jgi:Domain of unknown function (DUF929)
MMTLAQRRRRASGSDGPPAARRDESPKKRPIWRRPSTFLVLVTAAVVVAGITVGVVRAHGPGQQPAAGDTAASDGAASLLQEINGISPAVVRAVGSGGLHDQLQSLGTTPILEDSATKKPIVFFVASEACPDCAAQRWPLVLALARFGTFSHLPLIALDAGTSSPALATFTFAGAAYTSPYIVFSGAELKDLTGKQLQSLGTAGQQLVGQYDAPPYVAANTAGFIPWLDIANRFAMQGSSYSPAVIGNLDWGHVVTRFSNAGDPVTKAIVGSANYITAAICSVTSMQPSSVCTAAPIASMAANITRGGASSTP